MDRYHMTLAAGVLYFVTESQFARWDGTRVEVLGYWPFGLDTEGFCAGGVRPVALWGNSATEVFLAVAEPNRHRPGTYCNTIAVLRWDGTGLHQF
ncbi:MAG: hypothetical protein HY905_21105 [Deltaproteobacteria bacterium]|nr:hypothetical protein [Deltaproteobacteria bacterium]